MEFRLQAEGSALDTFRLKAELHAGASSGGLAIAIFVSICVYLCSSVVSFFLAWAVAAAGVIAGPGDNRDALLAPVCFGRNLQANPAKLVIALFIR